MEIDENEFLSNQYKYSESIIINFLDKTKYLENYYKIDYIIFIKIYPNLNDETKKKLIQVVDITYIILLVTNNLIDLQNIWKNETLFRNVDNTVELFLKNNLLKNALDYIDNSTFIKLVQKLSFYNLFYIYEIIKTDKIRLEIFINSISYVCLDALVSKMDEQVLKFISYNINFLARLDLTGNLFAISNQALNQIKISKLQIILLLGTPHEALLLDKLFSFEIDFIKKIINLLSNETFLLFFNRSSIDQFYQYIKYVHSSKLKLIVNSNVNKHILNSILKEVNIIYLSDLIPLLNIHQIIDATYELCDEKVILISKNLSPEHSNYLQFLFNNMPNFESSISKVSKQILCFLSANPNIRKIVINNFDKLSNSQIVILINLLNSEDIFNCLKIADFDQKNLILTSISNEQISPLSDFIDRKLDRYTNGIENIREKILFKIITFFVKLNLSDKNRLLIKNIQ